jgi:hypothetical protein
MITTSGTRPVKRLPTRTFHERFVCGTGLVPDFCVDPGILMQNQEADNAPTECTAYYTTDARTDVDRMMYSPDFSYAATMYIEGVTPNTGGAEPLAALEAGILRGFRRKDFTGISAAQNGELFVANWNNWSKDDKTLALANRIADVHNALGNGDPFTSITNACYTARIGVGIVTPWYPEWNNPLGGGVLQMPADLSGAGCPWHMHAIKGQKTIGGSLHAMDKSWQGNTIGDNGWLYMPAPVLNAVMTVPGTCALIPVTTGSRFIPVVNILLSHKQLLATEFGQLFTT